MRKQTTSWSFKTALRRFFRSRKASRKPQPHLGADRKDEAMKLFSRPQAKRVCAFASAAVTLTTMALLAGCGGGGGGAAATPVAPAPPPVAGPAPVPTPPVAAPPPIGVAKILAVSQPVITDNNNTGEAEVTVEVTGAPVSGLTAQGANGANPVSAEVGIHKVMVEVIGVDAQAVKLSQGTTVLEERQVSPVCSERAVWDTVENSEGKCTPKMCYTDKVTALMGQNATIYSIDKDHPDPAKRVVQATNLTGWTVPLASGWLPPPAVCVWRRANPDPVGRLVAACSDPATTLYRLVYYYPTTGEMRSFNDDTIDIAEIASGVDYLPDVGEFSGLFSGWGHHLELDDGWLFHYDGIVSSQFAVWFQPKGDPLQSPIMLYEDPEEFGYPTSIKLFSKWSNSCAPTQQ